MITTLKTSNPLTYALKNDGSMNQMEKISNKHKGDSNKSKKQLLFLVHRTGYKDPSWKPWSKVRPLSQLHEYVKNHKIKKVRNLLPKTFELKHDAFLFLK